ncbi:N-terminal acetyltransferase A complex catalytic subunit ard1 [Tulasnella sp. 330]|nr:N-terminal acetyltransferase A complex catalytic subunit ard1 [Tulasnella sp. 330]
MDALYYSEVGKFGVKRVDIPQIKDDQVLVKVLLSGMCGTDQHIHHGEFISSFPLVPGHEVVGTISKLGNDVQGFKEGDRVVADPGITCGSCFYCRRGKSLMCETFIGLGVSGPHAAGGFTEYFAVEAKKLYKLENLSDEGATLVEPTACAVHGMDQLKLPIGSEVLLIGERSCGPTGIMMAQLLKLNGAQRIVIVAPAGPKLDLGKKLGLADEYIALDRSNPKAQWEELKQKNPYGFDAVIEATGVESVVDDSINYVRRGGTLLVYGVYSAKDRVRWSPAKIFQDEIRIIGSFAQTYSFPRAVAYLESGKLKTEGIITHVFGIDEYQKALDLMASRQCIKIAIRPTMSS